MLKINKNSFQDIHYNRQKAGFCLSVILGLSEFFYKKIIICKNFLYEKNIFKEQSVNCKVICVGNLTTGGVGKTPIVINLANKLSKTQKVAIISRGYKAKLSNKNPNIIKDYQGIKFKNGELCGDEPFQLSKKVNNNVIVITCANRKKAIDLAIIKYGINVAILDDGFSNRKVKKDETYIAIDSAMRFGNNHLLPFGPLREPLSEIKRADEIILVDKQDENLKDAITWAKQFNKKINVCKMQPKRIYNMATNAEIKFREEKKAIAFCAIGQPKQFFNFVSKFYNLIDCISFDDHHSYTKADIKSLISIAKKHKINTFITTQKDEAKLHNLTKNILNYSFNVLELETIIENY